MNTSLQLIQRTFPDYDPETDYEAALPLYRLRLTVKTLESHSLSVIARFILRAVALGVSTSAAIAHLFGLQEKDTASATVELLTAGLLAHGAPAATGGRHLTLTDAGTQQVTEAKNLLVPRKRILHMHFDPLTNQLRSQQSDAVSTEEVRKDGLYVIPVQATRPTINDIELTAVQRVIKEDGGLPDGSQVITLLSLQHPYVEYLRGIRVFVLVHRQTKEHRIAAFRSGRYLPGESEAIQELGLKGVTIIPADADGDIPDAIPLDVHAILPAAAETAQEVLDKDRLLDAAERELSARLVARSGTQDKKEQLELEGRIAALIAQVTQLKEDKDRLQDRLNDQQLEILRTEDHRRVLETALKEAKEEIVIISPWMNTRTVDEPLAQLFAQAVRRGVRIRIGYGFGFDRNGPEGERNRASANAVRAKLTRTVDKALVDKLKMVNLGDTHEKLLICDRQFAVTTSFNWLSYRGDLDEGYRRETGALVRSLDAVDKIARRALEAFAAVEQRPQNAQRTIAGRGTAELQRIIAGRERT